MPVLLLVDDSDAEDCLPHFEKEGFFVVTANDGEAAVRLIEEGLEFDVLVCDRELDAAKPGFHGCDVMEIAWRSKPEALRVGYSLWSVPMTYSQLHYDKMKFIPRKLAEELKREYALHAAKKT